MIQVKTLLNVVDNSGAKYAKCIKVLQTKSAFGKKKIAVIGDIVLVSLRKVVPRKRVKKGDIFKALVVRSKIFFKRQIGQLNFEKNAIILLDKKMQALGTRFNGSIPRELKRSKHLKQITILKLLV